MATSAPLALLLLSLLSGSSAQLQQQVGGGGAKVKVEVYFSSLCSDSMRFFTNQLYPTWQKLQDIIDLELIPYGKARATPLGNDYSFECQHGSEECYGNKVMTCVQASLPITTQVSLLHCMMAQGFPPYAGPQCSRELGVQWDPLQRCADSVEASRLLYQKGVRTAGLTPRLYFVPTITINGEYTRDRLRTSLRDLESQVCAAYQGPPHQGCL